MPARIVAVKMAVSWSAEPFVIRKPDLGRRTGRACMQRDAVKLKIGTAAES
ncbi:MAG: hypothetical protein NZ739_10275 [Verrucomicrobiae bacterium]|nr:hypothetical protein [Verrucomicrobiae bacterium]